MSRPGIDKPAERLTREKQFWARVPIGAIFTITLCCMYCVCTRQDAQKRVLLMINTLSVYYTLPVYCWHNKSQACINRLTALCVYDPTSLRRLYSFPVLLFFGPFGTWKSRVPLKTRKCCAGQLKCKSLRAMHWKWYPFSAEAQWNLILLSSSTIRHIFTSDGCTDEKHYWTAQKWERELIR